MKDSYRKFYSESFWTEDWSPFIGILITELQDPVEMLVPEKKSIVNNWY